MAQNNVVGAFDQISRVYDSTREPTDPATLDRLVEVFARWGIVSLLEVGVGTGRMALPLQERGVQVTGVDASRGMLDRARAKGIERLVRGGAYRLPFADRCVDAAFFVHVLHLLEEARSAIAEGCRVGRLGAVALVRPRPAGRPDYPVGEESDPKNPRRLVYEYLAREGYPVPRGAAMPHVRERRLLAECPPDRLEVVHEEDITEPLARRLDLCAAGASRWTLGIPPEVLRRAVDQARAAVGDRTVSYHRVEALALWTRAPPGPSRAP